MPSALVLYAPVLHQGYLELLERRSSRADYSYVLSDEIVEECAWGGRREIREVSPDVMVAVLNATGSSREPVRLLTREAASVLSGVAGLHLVMPKLEICRRFAEHYLPHVEIEWDTVFLQWDEANVTSKSVVEADNVISREGFDRQMIALGVRVAAESPDWWRHVGAVVVHDGEVVMTAFNHHVPSEQTAYINADPRDFVQAGTDSEIATALHAEQTIIVKAARQGVSLEGCDLYTPVFPCPMCAKQIAYSGIKRVFFAEGHASLDGQTILKDQNIDIVLVR